MSLMTFILPLKLSSFWRGGFAEDVKSINVLDYDPHGSLRFTTFHVFFYEVIYPRDERSHLFFTYFGSHASRVKHARGTLGAQYIFQEI